MSGILLGNNLAMLVAAHELGRMGKSVTLVNEGRQLGGHFCGLRVGDVLFDIGMVLMESPAHGAPASDVADYDPGSRHDAARFTSLVEGFIASIERRSAKKIPTPECLIDGRRVPDYMIANRTEAFFGSVNDAPPSSLEAGPRHAAHAGQKHVGRRFDTLPYAQAAAHNHGVAFHTRFFAPFEKKVIGDGAARLLARYHRSAWLPLYHPETIHAAIFNQKSVLPEYAFHSPGSGSVAAWTHALASACASFPSVTILDSKVTACDAGRAGYALTLDDGRRIEGDRLALGTTIERACTLAGQPPGARYEGASIRIAFFMVRQAGIRKAGSCVFIVDAWLCAYRVTDIDECSDTDTAWHRVVVEAGVSTETMHLPQEARERALTALDEVLKADLMAILNIETPGDVRHLQSLTGRDAISIPDAASVAAMAASLDQLAWSMPGVHLTGAASGINTATMNDQIVQGLKLAGEWL